MVGWNLALRFLLELAALAGFAVWTWSVTTDSIRIVAAVIVVILLGAVWATFAVPGDPSRSGNAPVPVPGTLRLVLELAILYGGAFAFHLAGASLTGIAIAILITLHYVLSLERVSWLLQQ